MGGVSAILLAAGESTRMGRPKALLPWQGHTLLEHQVHALQQAGVQELVVVLGHGHQEVQPLLRSQPGLRSVLNPHYRQGKTTSIKAGLAALESPESILILAVDQPRKADTIGRVMEAHRQSGADITIPAHRGKGGHPTIFSARLQDELKAISEETLGIRAVVRRHKSRTHRVEMPTEEVLLDLNTPQDYQRAARYFA